MNFDFTFTEMETCILEEAVKLLIEYDQDCLEEETDEDPYYKAMWVVEIIELNNILKKIQEKLVL